MNYYLFCGVVKATYGHELTSALEPDAPAHDINQIEYARGPEQTTDADAADEDGTEERADD